MIAQTAPATTNERRREGLRPSTYITPNATSSAAPRTPTIVWYPTTGTVFIGRILTIACVGPPTPNIRRNNVAATCAVAGARHIDCTAFTSTYAKTTAVAPAA